MINLFEEIDEVAPPPLTVADIAAQEPIPFTDIQDECNEFLDEQEVTLANTTPIPQLNDGVRYTIGDILGYDQLPDSLTEQQATEIVGIIGSANDAIARIEQNAERMQKPHEEYKTFVLAQTGRLLHKYGRENVKLYTRGKNKGEPKEKYVQLSTGRILLGKTGGVECFHGGEYQAWLKNQENKKLIEWGATVTFECKLGELTKDELALLNRVGKLEIHLGKNKVEELMTGENPVAVGGWKQQPIDELGKFRGVE